MSFVSVSRSIDLELYDTLKETVEKASESFVRVPREGSKGVKAAVMWVVDHDIVRVFFLELELEPEVGLGLEEIYECFDFLMHHLSTHE